MSEWSPVVAMTAQVVDAVRALTATQIAIAGGKPKFKPVVRPITAMDRAKHELKLARHAHVMDRVEEARARARADKQPN